jgi:Uma2 family endonuclease
MATTKLFTAADLEHLEDDGYRYDLIEGELYRMAPANFEHGGIAAAALAHLWNFVVPRGLGIVVAAETGFQLHREPDTVLAPDVAFVRADRLPAPDERRQGFLSLAPDLVVEVISPSESHASIERKVTAYLTAGVILVWTVHPVRQQVIVYRQGRPPRILNLEDMLDGEDVIPGFRLPLSELFRVSP